MLSQLQRSIRSLNICTSVQCVLHAVRLCFLSWLPASLVWHHFKVRNTDPNLAFTSVVLGHGLWWGPSLTFSPQMCICGNFTQRALLCHRGCRTFQLPLCPVNPIHSRSQQNPHVAQGFFLHRWYHRSVWKQKPLNPRFPVTKTTM